MKKRVTAMLIVLTMLLGLMPGTAWADSKIKNLAAFCEIDKLDLDTKWTEGQVKKRFIDNVINLTIGAEIDKANCFLVYEDNGIYYGIGSGTALVNESRRYYLECNLKTKTGYDWPDEVKAVGNEYIPISKCNSVRAFFNYDRMTEAQIRYNSYWNEVRVLFPIGYELSSADISKNTLTYNGKNQAPTVTSVIADNGKTLSKENYSISYTDLNGETVMPVSSGSYKMMIEGEGIYRGTINKTFQIDKAANLMNAQNKTVKIKASKLKNKRQIIKCSRSMGICTAVGKLQFELLKVNKKKFKKYFKVNANNGDIIIKKGLKKGTYELMINVTASGDGNYLPGSAPVTVTIKVK